MQVLLTPEQHQWLRRAAFDCNCPMTEIVRRVIDDVRNQEAKGEA